MTAPELLRLAVPVLLALSAPYGTLRAQVAVVSNYTQDFNSIGTALPIGWGVWTDSTSAGNGNAFTWSTGAVANNAAASASTYFRNVPGASQAWTAGLSSGADRAIGWRAGTAGSRDGSITFTFADTTGWIFSSLSLELFTPNSSGTAVTIQLQYEIGSGTFAPLTATSYITDIAQSPLTVTLISLTSGQLVPLNNQSGQVTLRLDNLATSGAAFNTVALDNFSYSASAIPEASRYATIAGGVVLGAAAWRRRRWYRSR